MADSQGETGGDQAQAREGEVNARRKMPGETERPDTLPVGDIIL